jgi:hypothetical protein
MAGNTMEARDSRFEQARSTREAKLGYVFTQTMTDEKGERLRDPDSMTYVGTCEGCRQSGILLHGEALRRGY